MESLGSNSTIYKDRLFLGDNHDFLPKLPDNLVDLLLTDPPYKDYQSNRPVVNPKQKKIKSGEFDLPFFIEHSFRLIKPGGHFYCFCDHKTFPAIKEEAERLFTYKNCLVWVKNNHGSGDLRGDWAPKHEFIVFAVKGRGKPLNSPRPVNVLEFSRVQNEKFSHGTVKPVPLLKRIIEASTQPGELVLDPYAGVMSTAVACKETGRHYIMMEKDEDFFRRGEERLYRELNLF